MSTLDNLCIADYTHNDHPSALLRTSFGSPVLTTSASATATQVYYARACPERSRRGKVRRYSGSFPTRYQFTGQHIDDTDLMDSLRSPQAYMKARYGAWLETSASSVEPLVEGTRRTGQFISPDTLVPDPGLLIDYNRYGYARGNPMRFTDPSGHCAPFIPLSPRFLAALARWPIASVGHRKRSG